MDGYGPFAGNGGDELPKKQLAAAHFDSKIRPAQAIGWPMEFATGR
jgi:hypothetical protein